MLFGLFDVYEAECRRLIGLKLPLPAYDFCLKCSHTFNNLDARGAISVTERAAYIGRVRALAHQCAKGYLESRELLGFPLLPAKERAAAVEAARAARLAADQPAGQAPAQPAGQAPAQPAGQAQAQPAGQAAPAAG
jgi:glycyl-tRNA synthetase alpha chain